MVETKEVKVVETKEVIKEVVKEVTPTAETVEFWTPEEVTAATGAEKCTALATLPKKLTKATKIGFVGANNAHPFHGLVQKGIADAAKFYGVEFVDMDAAGNPGARPGRNPDDPGRAGHGRAGPGHGDHRPGRRVCPGERHHFYPRPTAARPNTPPTPTASRMPSRASAAASCWRKA